MKILIGVLSCNANKAQQNILRETWFKHKTTFHHKSVPYIYESYFICGSNDEHFGIHNDVVNIPAPDTYEGHVEKTLEFYKWSLCKDFDYLFKVDDDAYCQIDKLCKLEFTDYTGNIVDGLDRSYHKNKVKNFQPYEGPYLGSYAAGGCGYLLSRKSVEIIAKSNRDFSKEVWEDKYIGDILRIGGIIGTHSNKLSDQASDGKSYLSKSKISMHPMNIDQIKEMHKMLGK